MEKTVTALRLSLTENYRYLSIDVYKGIMIAFAIFINATSYFQNTPVWNKGSDLYGLTYVDLFGPLFLFALTMTFKTSFNRRIERIGAYRTYRHFIRRFCLYIIIGFVITMNINPSIIEFRWGTLQMLGATGLFLLLTIKLEPRIRMTMAILITALYQFLILQISGIEIATIPHGGVIGLLPWFSFATIATLLNEHFISIKNKLQYGLIGIILVFTGFGMGFYIAISRQLVNLPFMLISMGISILIFLFLFYLFEDFSNRSILLKKERFFSVLGKNTLFLYILQSFLKLIPYVILPFDTVPMVFFSFGLLMVFMNYSFAFFMDKYEIYLII